VAALVAQRTSSDTERAVLAQEGGPAIEAR
jgi:hypothetical protein